MQFLFHSSPQEEHQAIKQMFVAIKMCSYTVMNHTVAQKDVFL